jgi:hypothetical protein
MKQVNSQEQHHFNELTSVFFNNEEWVVPRKYQLNAVIGHGAYGTVASATNLETGQEVAIKRNKNIFPKFLCDITLSPEKKKNNIKSGNSCASFMYFAITHSKRVESINSRGPSKYYPTT